MTEYFHLSRGELPELADLIQSLGLESHFQGEVIREGRDPILTSSLERIRLHCAVVGFRCGRSDLEAPHRQRQ